LFEWETLEDNPSLRTIKQLLDAIPDGKLINAFRDGRGCGCDDYPVHVLWRVRLLTIALRHTSIEACLAELRRNQQLRELVGIDGEGEVPKKWDMSRFQEVLGREPYLRLLKEVFSTMVNTLCQAVPALGQPDGGHKQYTDDHR
jgi:hypothetical protein